MPETGMKRHLKDIFPLLILSLLWLGLSSFSVPDVKPGRVKKEQRRECRKQNGSCIVSRQKHYPTPFSNKKIKTKSNRRIKSDRR
jgi:hypothetical protein